MAMGGRLTVTLFATVTVLLLCAKSFTTTNLLQQLQPYQAAFASALNNSRVSEEDHATIQQSSDNSSEGIISEAPTVPVPSTQMTTTPAASQSSADIPIPKVALCYKTLFGDIDLKLVQQWIQYYKWLGFDHFYLWYRSEMVDRPLFAEITNLSYVTMSLNNRGKPSNYFLQLKTEDWCFRVTANLNYTWTMIADIDEYLWFKERVGVKEFLMKRNELNYMSFGKHMYMLNRRVVPATEKDPDDASALFHVSQYPYTAGSFCFVHNLKRQGGNPICPTWKGRCKIMLRPQLYNYINQHGVISKLNQTAGQVHFHPTEAHMKEWTHLFMDHNESVEYAALGQPQTFRVDRWDYNSADVHQLNMAYQRDKRDDMVTIQYDKSLHEWFQFVGRNLSTMTR